MSLSKHRLGQFFTSNSQKVCEGLALPPHIDTLIDPQAGDLDLVKWVLSNVESVGRVVTYDIEPVAPDTVKRDTLMNPPDFTDAFVVANPPYLAKNKAYADDLELFQKYPYFDDKYEIFVYTLCASPALGGVLIVPVSFLSSNRVSDIRLRRFFFEIYQITGANIHTSSTFSDTDVNVVAFTFERQSDETHSCRFRARIVGRYKRDDVDELDVELSERTNWTLGSAVPRKPKCEKYRIRHVAHHHHFNQTTGERIREPPQTHVLVKCLDTLNERINMQYVGPEGVFYGKISNRMQASFEVLPPLSIEQQKRMCECFNMVLEEQRNLYGSMFLTNFRTKNRKRISYAQIIELMHYVLDD